MSPPRLLGATGLISPLEIATGIAIVLLGGIFPDIDSDRSDSIALIFNIFAIWIGSAAAICALPSAGLLASFGLLMVVYLFIRYASIIPFRRLTVHRGIFHSTPMAIFLTLFVCLLSFHLFDLNSEKAWIFSALFFVGFMTHLILDECYSVDLANIAIKRSFGTAIKLVNRKHIFSYILLYGMVGVLLYLSPSTSTLKQQIADIQFRLLPTQDLLIK